MIICHLTGAVKGPFNVSIEATAFSVHIEWIQPSDNITFVIGYNITVKTLVTKATRTVYVEDSSREANVTGLSPFTKYSFTVTAEYKYGLGPPSEAVVQKTREHGKLPTAPLRVNVLCTHVCSSCGNYLIHRFLYKYCV